MSGTYSGRRCMPANSDVCPEMNVKGAERLMTARGKALDRGLRRGGGAEVRLLAGHAADHLRRSVGGEDRAAAGSRELHLREGRRHAHGVARGEGHQPPRNGLLFMHGYSTGRYEGNQLVVESSRFTFDPEGFAGDAINAPSSTQKRLVERYSRRAKRCGWS